MSKKNKKKLRKILRAKLAQEGSTVSHGEAPTTQVSEITQENTPANSIQAADSNPDTTLDETHEVKREIRNILLTVVSLVVVILVLYFINARSDIILKAGEWLANNLNINV